MRRTEGVFNDILNEELSHWDEAKNTYFSRRVLVID